MKSVGQRHDVNMTEDWGRAQMLSFKPGESNPTVPWSDLQQKSVQISYGVGWQGPDPEHRKHDSQPHWKQVEVNELTEDFGLL